jgi:signal transduction histidine kinase
MRGSTAGGDAEFASYIKHTYEIVRLLPEIDETIGAIQSSNTAADAQDLQNLYLDGFALISSRSSWSRIFLGSLTGVLCFYIAVLVYRLRRQSLHLEQRLDFETLIAEVRNWFDEEPLRVESAITSTLEQYASFFEASRYAFAIVDMDTGGIKESYGDTDDPTHRAIFQRFGEQIQKVTSDDKIHHDRFVYHNLTRRNFQEISEETLSTGAMTAGTIDARTAGALILRRRSIRTKPDHGEVRLLGQAVVALNQNLRAHRERLAKEVLEARLDHSERLEAVGTLAGGIAHEFNNALGAILGYGEMALQLRGTSARTRHYVSEIVASGQRAKHIIDQVLTFSRKRERISRPFDTREAIDEIVPLVRLAVHRSIEVQTSIPEQLPAVLGNPIEFQQVIMNLCMNAAEAITEQGLVTVSAQRAQISRRLCLSHGDLSPGMYVLVTVKDTGHGIRDAVLPHIFDPFFTTKSPRGGTGLGLAAVHGHVTGMNGKIDVRSQSQVGTRFSLYFPALDEPPIPLSRFFNERTVPLGRGEMVLIAQRDTNLRLMYEEKIAALGYEPVGFATLDDLETWLRQKEKLPDIILLDVDLWDETPNLSEVVERFLPVNTLVMTDPERDGISRRSAPDITFLRKPVTSVALASALFNGIGICHLP